MTNISQNFALCQPKDGNDHALNQRIQDEVTDNLDEEELELDDSRLDHLVGEIAGKSPQNGIDRHVYFKELFRLQG